MRKIFYLSLFFLLASCKEVPVTITEMRCEYLTSPINLDAKQPRFTWIYASEGNKNWKQTACKLDIALSKEALEQDELFWSSGKMADSRSIATYKGEAGLTAHTRYYWRVTSWNQYNKTIVSQVDSFETAMMHTQEWKAQWITDDHDKSFAPAPMFRKTFSVEKDILDARVYISAAAYYKLFINGKVPNREKLDPGYTHYDKRNLYTTIDVTQSLVKGNNAIGVVLGNGFYNEEAPVATWDFEKAAWRDRARMILELHIHFTDGTKMIVPSDDTWKSAIGPYRYNNIYSGDTYDAREEIPDWNLASFDDGAWVFARTATAPSPNLVSQTAQPIRVIQVYPAVSMQSFGDSVYVFDMGINLTGVCEIKINGERGTKVTMTHGELLKDNGRLEMRNLDIYFNAVDGQQFQTDTYILRGGGEEQFTPDFTYHGFRYLEIKTDRPISIKQADVKAHFLHTDLEKVGHFRCSNDLLNKIWDATYQSYLSNLHSIPTDCPQREKNGWTADAHIAMDLALLNYDGIKFYEKWMNDFIDNQLPNGRISGIIPSAGWGYDDWIGPVWDAALFIIPDALEKYYGDTRTIESLYDTCERYLAYLKSRENEEGTVTYGIGDWVFYDTQTPTDYTSTCYYYLDNLLMTRFAGITGNEGMAYAMKADELKKLINEKYLNRETAIYANGSQTSLALALALRLVPEELTEKVAENLNNVVADNDYFLDFGLLGSKYVLRMLSDYGYVESAYRMATKETVPSWGHWIKQGFTTLGETWALSPEFRDASINHVFLGDISAWMTQYLAGINYDEEQRGFERIVIKPHFVDDLSWVEASYKSVKGLIKSEWKREGDQIRLTVTIPLNTSAIVYTDKLLEVEGGTHTFVFKK